MTAKVYALIATLGLAMFLAGASHPVRASQAIVAAIPFDFVVGEKTLPAGKYRIRPASDFNMRVLVIENLEESDRAVISTTAGDPTANDAVETLVFNRYGKEYYLASVSLRGIAACNVTMSEAEQALAAAGTARERVSLPMGSR